MILLPVMVILSLVSMAMRPEGTAGVVRAGRHNFVPRGRSSASFDAESMFRGRASRPSAPVPPGRRRVA